MVCFGTSSDVSDKGLMTADVQDSGMRLKASLDKRIREIPDNLCCNV